MRRRASGGSPSLRGDSAERQRGQSLSYGLMVGYGALVAPFALAEMVITQRFLRWRAWMTAGGPKEFVQISAAFDRVLLPERRSGSPLRFGRLRLLGMGLLLFTAVVEAVAWWMVHAAGIV